MDNSKIIPLSKIHFGKAEERAVLKVLRSGWLSHGPNVQEFEAQFAAYHSVSNAVAANSCTSVLQLALTCSWEINKKKIHGRPKVILPSFTFAASANAVINAGFEPVFVDIEPNTWHISPECIEEVIDEKTFAIMIVHFAGLACPMDKILPIVQKNNLILIEDSAEAIGSTFNDKKTGSFGIGCFSFFPTKNITTAEGGMLTTCNTQLADLVRLYIAHGISRKTKAKVTWQREAKLPGYNFRMNELQAALGIVQFKKLDKMNNRRREIATFYNQKLADMSELILPLEPCGYRHVYQMYTPIIRTHRFSRDHLVQTLNQRGIGASVHFDPPVHLQAFYRHRFPHLKLPVTENLSRQIFSLPIYTTMLKKDALRVIKTLKACMQQVSIVKQASFYDKNR